jgi:hypothetical protein
MMSAEMEKKILLECIRTALRDLETKPRRLLCLGLGSLEAFKSSRDQLVLLTDIIELLQVY